MFVYRKVLVNEYNFFVYIINISYAEISINRYDNVIYIYI